MNYVIVTPAYNEEKHIAQTIEGVLSQVILPKKWIIVDDGSTDQTAQIIRKYSVENPWIEYVCRTRDDRVSYYASNVYAINEGVKHLEDTDYEYLAILDSDITLFPEYYRKIGNAFAHDSRLGICSGNCVDNIDGQLREHLYDRRSCAKAVMVFRKECFEQIGGFVPLPFGGEDTCACFAGRMHGWKTWAFHEWKVVHNKPLGTGVSKSILSTRFRQGRGEYFLGYHPIFVILKSIRRCLKEPPYVIGGLMRLYGFIYAHFMSRPRQVADPLRRYIRQEQWQRVIQRNKIPVEFQVEMPL